MVRARLYIPPPASSPFDDVLNIAEHYDYEGFISELVTEGMDVSPVVDSDDIEKVFLLYHTLGANASPVPQIKEQFSLKETQRIIPLQTTDAGALDSVLNGGVLAAVEGRGYGRWLRGDQPNDQSSGLVTSAATAEAFNLDVLETFRDAAFIRATERLPKLLAEVLMKHVGRMTS